MMRLFKDSRGFVIAFGFDLSKRQENPQIISWLDPDGECEPKPNNMAGWTHLSYSIAPQFVCECGGIIVAYQPGQMVELVYVGTPMIFSIKRSLPEQ